MDTNGWKEYEKMVMFRLETMEAQLALLIQKVTALELKAGLKGAVIGALPGIAAAIYLVLR